jgi:hypothetical protein
MVEILTGPALQELGAIIVAPDSVRGDWSTPENEKAVIALLDMVASRYAIDKKRTAVTGYSMGGTGSWTFAQKFPDRFAAAIPIASRPPSSAAGWHLPVLAIHSRNDQVAPFAPAEARIAELQKAGVNAKLIALSGITHYETNRFQGALRQAVPWLREFGSSAPGGALPRTDAPLERLAIRRSRPAAHLRPYFGKACASFCSLGSLPAGRVPFETIKAIAVLP